MASLSGLVSLNCDKLTIRKPRPSFEKQDVFDVFIRSPEGFSRYEPTTQAWNPFDNSHVPGTLDMYTHTSASISGVFNQLLELRREISIELDSIRPNIAVLQDQVSSLQQHLVDTIAQIGTLSQQVTAQGAQIDALAGKVEEQEQETGGLWAHIESIIGWVNFIGAMLSRIEGILVTLGLL